VLHLDWAGWRVCACSGRRPSRERDTHAGVERAAAGLTEVIQWVIMMMMMPWRDSTQDLLE
jgi:hypothetical protein